VGGLNALNACHRPEECKGHAVESLMTDSSRGSGGVIPENQWSRLKRSAGASNHRELSVLCVGDLCDITLVLDEIKESEMQGLEGEFKVSDSTETVKPQWMEGRVNLLCLQPVPGPDLVQPMDLSVVKQEVPVGIQPMDLSIVKQEAPGGPSAPKQEEEPGEEEGAETPFRQLPKSMDFSDHKQLVDDLVLRPKMEQMDDNPSDNVEIDYDWKQQEGGTSVVSSAGATFSLRCWGQSSPAI
jgi:hypothetical protein